MPALLVKATKARMMPLEPVKRLECFVGSAKIALRYGREQQRLALLWIPGKQRITGGQCLEELSLSQERPDSRQLGSDRGCRQDRVRSHWTSDKKKGGLKRVRP